MKKTAKRAGVWIVSVLVVLLGFGGEVLAAKGTPGPPEGEGSGDHGRKKDSDDQGYLLGLIYGDQWVIVRDVSAEGDGQPIYFNWTWPPEAYNAEGDFDPQLDDLDTYNITVETSEEPGCVQPVTFEEVADLGSQFYVSDTEAEYYDSYGRVVYPTYLIPLDPECKIPAAFEETWGEQVMEADAGRLNLSRSPQAVLDASYEEALVTLNQALAISRDPAGRLMFQIEIEDEDGLPVSIWKTVDSPLQNLSMYQMVMQAGCLQDTANVEFANDAALTNGGLGHLVCGVAGELPDDDDFLRAASFLAGAGDKTGRINVDLVVYLNNRLELNGIVWSANKREILGIDYYDFQDFVYDRCVEHGATVASLLQPNDNSGNYPETFRVEHGVTIFDKRFTNTWPAGECQVNGYSYGPYAAVDADTPIINFVRAADDALVIINYIHNYELPAYPLDPVVED